jgi:hypothetical protein
MPDTPAEPGHGGGRLDAICILLLVAYFLHFALPALRGGFRGDEMMNMAIYWKGGMLKSLWANVTFWTTFYRPAGALYYLPIYHFFALDPLPYRIVQISILAVSIPIIYGLSRCLTSSRSIAFLAVLALCYHPRVADLVFTGAFIYDVLCGFFYFAALTYYIHSREKDHPLSPLQLFGFLALYICALNSKEMAVTLPVMVLIYELLRCHRWINWKAFFRWSWSIARPSLIAGLLTVVYTCGKTHGTGSLTRYDPYRPKISWHNFFVSNTTFVTDLLYLPHPITPMFLLVLWGGVFSYAFLRRDRTLQFMAFWVVIVPLPIAFLVPLRAGACLYLLLFGWAMIFAIVIIDLIALVSKFRTLLAQGVGACSATATATGSTIRETGSSAFTIVAVIVVAVGLGIFTRRENQRYNTVQTLVSVGQKVSHVIEALKSLHFQPPPQSTILMRIPENAFANRWHGVFAAYLLWNDHSLNIWLEGVSRLTPQQLAKVDYIIFLNEFQAKVIRAPQVSK